ncbi:MAG: GNAT family N-acetyltransferase [Pyrinomonadaceae bacterium]|nr:GNAT family N-acetyltransferase [Pyrinomonadaceae bacterium]
MELKIFKGREVIDSGLGERIIEFDKMNMREVWEKARMEFPEERRRKGLESNPTFIVAFEGERIAGYLEYLRSWNDPRYIYVGSIQISERHRNTRLILRLLDEFRSLVSKEDFLGFETNVQKTNAPAVRMYRKIGFKLEENPRNPASWLARAGKELLTNSPVLRLIDKWRAKALKQ